MSSKFNSATMLNKTPPVCQKHQPSPDVPPGTIWPTIIGSFTIYQPLTAPTEIWSRSMTLQLVTPPRTYEIVSEDDQGRVWAPKFNFSEDYEGVIGGINVVTGPDRAAGFSADFEPTMQSFPLDSGLVVASIKIDCDNVTWRFTV